MKVTLIHAAIGGFAFPVEKTSPLVLGRRGAELDLELAWDPRISRRHARLWVDGGALWYEDLDSRNGSWIGDRRLSTAVRLHPGDSVLLGETALVVSHGEGPALRSVEETHSSYADQDSSDLVASPTRTGTLPGIVPTDDLRVAAAEASETKRRQEHRLLDERRVDILLGGRDDLRDLWTRDISKGGLFLETEDPPPPGTKLVVSLQTPHGALQLNATVVHILTAERARQYGTRPGAGLAFSDLDETKRSAIRAYVDGLEDRLAALPPAVVKPTKSTATEDVLPVVRRVLEHADDDAFYAALDLYPTASAEQVASRIDALVKLLAEHHPRLSPPQAARVKAASAALARIRRVLGSDRARLEYDFRYGHVRSRARIAQARDGSGPSLAVLRRVWNRVAPDRVDQAALLTREAFAMRQAQNLPGAIEHGRRALELNPFFEELRKTVETWEEMIGEEVGRLPRTA